MDELSAYVFVKWTGNWGETAEYQGQKKLISEIEKRWVLSSLLPPFGYQNEKGPMYVTMGE